MSKRLRDFDAIRKNSHPWTTTKGQSISSSSSSKEAQDIVCSSASSPSRDSQDDEVLLEGLYDSIEEAVGDKYLCPSNEVLAINSSQPPRKRACVEGSVGSANGERRRFDMEEARARLQLIRQEQQDEALAFVAETDEINEGSFGRFHHIVDPLDPPPYVVKKKAMFGITMTLGKIIVDSELEILDSHPVVARLRELLRDIFVFKTKNARTDSEKKKAYGAFLKVKEWEPKYGSKSPKESTRPHPFDCITGSDFWSHMEVMTGKTKALHVQGCLEVYYDWDGHYFQFDFVTLKSELLAEGFEITYINVNYVKTDEFDAKQYVMIPNSQKTEKQRLKVMEKAGVPSGEASVRRFKK